MTEDLAWWRATWERNLRLPRTGIVAIPEHQGLAEPADGTDAPDRQHGAQARPAAQGFEGRRTGAGEHPAAFVESAVGEIIAKRMNKKQQMR